MRQPLCKVANNRLHFTGPAKIHYPPVEAPMNPLCKDVLELLIAGLAAIGGLLAAWAAIVALQRGNQERAEANSNRKLEFRWRKAELSRTIIDQIWGDPLAGAALKMLDWEGVSYAHNGHTTAPITSTAMVMALRTNNCLFSEDEQFIRDCFDALFDGFERIEHYVRIELILWEDVQGRIDYFATKLAERKATITTFLDTYGFPLAKALLERFPQWNTLHA
jgi:hypothetical protein